MEDTDTTFPADWTLELAMAVYNAPLPEYLHVTLDHVKLYANEYGNAASIIAHARLIEKFQPELKPVDPLLIEARKIAADCDRDNGAGDEWVKDVLNGEFDYYSVVQIALAALRRGMELAA